MMNKRLEKIVRETYETVPIYVRNREKLKINMEEIVKEEKWEDIPVLERNQIISEETSVMAPSAVSLLMANKLIFARTSGSTGKYMEIWWKKEDYNKSMLPLWYYRNKYYGILPQDKMCYFYTVHNVEEEEKSFLRKSELGFSKMNLTMERLSDIWHEMKEFQPKWLMLQPEIAMLLCKCMDRYGLARIESVQYIEFSGEILTDTIRQTVKEHFECRMANQYGANEFNSIAYECPYGNMHLMSENVYVEVLNENGECVAGEEGEVYVTSLTNSVMPLIRYRIGDRGKLEMGKKCLCKNHNPVFQLSSGRADDWIVLADSEKVMPNVLIRAFDCVNYRMDGVIKQFQAIQEDIGQFLVRLVVEEEDEYLKKEIEELFMESLEDERLRAARYRFEYQEELFPDEETGKLKWFKNIIIKEELYE